MSVNPARGTTQASSPDHPVVNPQPPASSTKSSSAIPEDTVTLSAAAKAKQAGSSGDVDRGGDSK